VKGALPCTGAVLRVSKSGGPVELVAWGFRNPFGLAFAPDGTLYVTDNMYDDRGSRPVHGAGDVLWAVPASARGTWYGWPDYHAGKRLDDGDHFDPPGGPKPKPLLAEAPNEPPKALAIFGVHSSSDGLDVSRSERFGHVGEVFVAQFGDMAPGAGRTMHPVGFKVVRVDPKTGVSEDFAVNKGRMNGPASYVGSAGLERPVAVRFDPSGSALWVVDFGVMTTSKAGPSPKRKTGALFKITRSS
jgi:glucose/arabinose dehydrogenase